MLISLLNVELLPQAAAFALKLWCLQNGPSCPLCPRILSGTFYSAQQFGDLCKVSHSVLMCHTVNTLTESDLLRVVVVTFCDFLRQCTG